MVDDPWNSDADLEAKRLAGSAAPPPVGAEFIPPSGQNIATKEQIANFWAARKGWTEEERDTFLANHKELEDQKVRLDQTERMRAEIRPEIAQSMSPDDIKQRYEELGLKDRAEQFAKTLKFHEAGEDRKTLTEFCVKEGVAVLKFEEQNARKAADARAEANTRTGRGAELTEAQQARIDRQMERDFRETSNELTRPHRGHGM